LSLLTAAGPASADLVYNWTLSGVDSGSGTLTAGAADGSGFDITALTGTIDGDPIDGLLGSPLDPGGPTISPLGAFIYDNIVYPGSAPVFDTPGVLFSISGTEGNIWGNNGPNDYSYYMCCYAVANDQVDTFALTQAAVSEPSSLALFASGLFGLWFVRRRKAA
jgi:PEP-CTERM motif